VVKTKDVVMDRTERLYKIDRMFNERKVIPVTICLDELEV